MMPMVDYLAAIQYAAENLIPIIWQERNQLEKVKKDVELLAQRTEDEYQRAERATMYAENPDDVAEAAGFYWDTYFGVDKERYYKNQDMVKLVDNLTAIGLSLDALAGCLLQFGKQGISLCHNGLAACPNGRAFGSQFLKDVVWQGRNQALHWEAQSFHPPVQDCFDKLSNEFDPVFSEYTKRSMASDVVKLLEWMNFAKFKADMLSLA